MAKFKRKIPLFACQNFYTRCLLIVIPTDRRGGNMFILRMAFWLAVVIMLIPSDDVPSNKATVAEPPELSVDGAIGAAAATVSDMASFCDRNQKVCDTGARAFDVFLAKAENGARLAYRILSDVNGDVSNGNERDLTKAREANLRSSEPASSAKRGTLRATDLLPAWQGPRDESI